MKPDDNDVSGDRKKLCPKPALREAGVDGLQRDISEGPCAENGMAEERRTDTLASALTHWDEICRRAAGRQPAVFLDYDGTLTPIVERPEDAVLSRPMRNTLEKLSHKFMVAVISGRELEDVRKRVGIGRMLYAGSHGFDIAGLGLKYRHAPDCLPLLKAAEQKLKEMLKTVAGVQVESKLFSIAVHYRRTVAEDVDRVENAVDTVLQGFALLRKAGGKKIFEIQPKIDWHKGKALLWVLKELKLSRVTVLPIYIGDDVTDEDAFSVLADDGVGIVVRDQPRLSRAAYALDGPNEVKQFLDLLVEGR